MKIPFLIVISIPAHGASKKNDETLDNMSWFEVAGMTKAYEMEEGGPRFLLYTRIGFHSSIYEQ